MRSVYNKYVALGNASTDFIHKDFVLHLFVSMCNGSHMSIKCSCKVYKGRILLASLSIVALLFTTYALEKKWARCGQEPI